MSAPEKLREQQQAFAAHIRDPTHAPAPAGIEDRRMAIYRDLFVNNVSKLLGGTFPVLKTILGDESWQRITGHFYAIHGCKTPYFLKIPEEFLVYLRNERTAEDGDPPFMLELAHYEWVELALSVLDDDPDLSDIDPTGDLLDGVPARSPLAWVLEYAFPVQSIGPDYQPVTPGSEPTYLVVYRDRNDKVGFIEINAVTAHLLALIDEKPASSGRAHLETIAETLGHPNPTAVVDGGRQILDDLRQHDVILGTRRNS